MLSKFIIPFDFAISINSNQLMNKKAFEENVIIYFLEYYYYISK